MAVIILNLTVVAVSRAMMVVPMIIVGDVLTLAIIPDAT